ncbi:MAG: hypothetical protein HY619_01595 [Thaumarchaeota archaeon]|nr:hypothetical protein [Nitrososphaerota archaeon]
MTIGVLMLLMLQLQDVVSADYSKVSREIQRFILNKVSEADAAGVAIGLSGGVDKKGFSLHEWFCLENSVSEA